jgi:hypothetical protein
MRQREATLGVDNAKELVREAKSLRKAYAANGARGYWLQKLKLLKADVKGRDAIDIGTMYSRLGNKDEAFRWLDIAFRQHLPYLIWDLPANPALDGLRSDLRYADVLRRLVPRSE